MDEFVKNAFADAVGDIENMQRVKKLFAENADTMFQIFIKHIGDDRAVRFGTDVIEKYEEELFLLLFIFFTAGYTLKGE